MSMHNPPHPGEIVRHLCLEPLNLTVAAAADALGVHQAALSEVLDGQGGVSPEMAIRLEQVFGSSADAWLGMQTDFDLWQARSHADRIKVNRRFVAEMPA